ncbi:MAG: choice-of-anchor I family protein [Pseudomonadota bacterium]
MTLHTHRFLAALVLLAPLSVHAWFQPQLTLTPIGTYESGIFDDSAAEIVAYDPRTRRVFVVNAGLATVDVLDIRDPSNPTLIESIDVTAAADSLGEANSIDVSRGILAVAIARDPEQLNGIVAFYDTRSLTLLGTVDVGALPDMLTFTDNGKTVLVANEGEPDDDYVVDPEGSISIIDIRRGVHRARVRTADFKAFNAHKDALIAAGVRIFGPNATVAQDLEPEYITIDANGRIAYVALQEANALAIVNIRRAKVIDIVPLGTKDHSVPGNELDASNRDDGINIRNWPVVGMYQPDAIASFSAYGQTFIATANEGDSRDYDGFSEEERVGDLALDPNDYPDAVNLQLDENLGRLQSTTATGDLDGDGLIDLIHSYGARSFSIFDRHGSLVYDSGADFENITANLLPDDFNSTNDENDSFDNRSDDKGPEPEGIVVGRFLGQTLAFIGFERIGGIAVYNVSNPYHPRFETYVNNRDFSVEDVTAGGAGDLGPEGLTYIPWYLSPNFRPLLIVGAEVSGTTTVYQLGIRFF